MRKTSKFRFAWVKAGDVLDIPKKNRKLRNMMVAVCEYSKRVAKLGASELEIMIVQDTYHTDGSCEESLRCVDFDCPLNQTTWDTWKAAGEVGPRVRRWENFGERIGFNSGPDGLNDFSFVFAAWKKQELAGNENVRSF